MKDAQFHRDEFARHFGIEVSQEMVKIQGRVLDAPAIEYKVSCHLHFDNSAHFQLNLFKVTDNIL